MTRLTFPFGRSRAESAFAAADIADKQEPLGPVHGVPFTIKENIDCVGSSTTMGVPLLAEALPPELERVTELWGHVLSAEFQPVINELAMLMSERSIGMLNQLFKLYNAATVPGALVHAEKWRLSCAWSGFFERYPLVVGPTWTNIPFLHDADIADGGAKISALKVRHSLSISLEELHLSIRNFSGPCQITQ